MKRQTMKQWLRWFALGASICALSVMAALAWLAGTESGLRWVLARAAPMLSGELTVDDIHGRLIGPLTAEHLRFRAPAADVRIARLELDWSPIALILGDVRLRRLFAQGVDIDIHPAPAAPAGSTTAFGLDVRDARIEQLSLRGAGAATFALARLDFRARLSNSGLGISRLYLERGDARFEMEGTLTASPQKEVNGEIRWSARVPGYPALTGAGSLHSDAARMATTQIISAPFAGRLTAELWDLDAAWRWSTRLDLEGSLDRVRPQWPALRVRTHVDADGDAKALQAIAQFDATHAQGGGTMRSRVQLGWRASGDGTLDVNWRDLTWPVGGKLLTSPSGELQWKGAFDNYALRLTAALRYGQTAGALRADGRGDSRALRLSAIHVGLNDRAGDSRIDGEARLAWTPELAWEAQLSGRDIVLDTNRIARLHAQARIGAGDARLVLSAEGIDLSGATIDRIALDATGPLARERVHAELIAGGHRLDLDAEGAYSDGNWQGAVTRGRIAVPHHGTWLTQAPAALALRADGLRLDRWCWQHGPDPSPDRVCAEAHTQRTATGDTTLQAHLVTDARDLTVISALVPHIEQLRGQLHADLRIDGTTARPRVGGSAALAQASFRVPALAIDVRDVNLRLQQADDRTLVLDGSARSLAGVLNVAGRLVFDTPGVWDARVAFTGTNLLAADTAQLRLFIAPDLTLHLQPHVARLDGTVRVTRADVRLKDSAGATVPSSDVTVVGAPPAETPWAIATRVRVFLGDDVRVRGFHFDGRVVGDVLVEEEPRRTATAQGELRVLSGRYTVYSKTLEVERGRLFYNGGPLDDPWLDVRATRRIGDVVAGVEARGTLKRPALTLISEPAMSDTDILAYLLLDHPIEQASSAEGQALVQASSAFELAGGELLARRIGSMFGIQDVRVEQQQNQLTKENQTSLVLGTYLSPRLYVSYGIGLFEAANALRLRYQLGPHWQIQTETGAAANGADLLYTIER